MSEAKNCKNCRKWDYTSNNFGFCRANAPIPMIVPDVKGRELALVWPSTGMDDWCMEFDATKIEETI
jgi:hypothetical protein